MEPTIELRQETNKNNESQTIDNDSILKQIFQTTKSESEKIKYIPLLNKTSHEIIKYIFTENPNFNSHNNLYKYILNKINLIKSIKEIIGNSYEILYIIFEFISQQDTSPFIYFIDLYLNYITIPVLNEANFNEEKNELIEKLKDTFSYFISCGLLNKKSVDYIYQKIALYQLEKKLTIKIFSNILPLLEIIYGKFCYDFLINDFIAKKYIYLYDKENSCIETNISQNNRIFIINGFYMIMWFYLNNYEESPKCSICEVTLNNIHNIKIMLNDDYDIEIQYNNINNNDNNTTKDTIVLKEQENKKFNLKQKIWTQLKIEFNPTEISLYLFQSNPKKEEETQTEILFEKKTYIITLKEKDEKVNFIQNYFSEQKNNVTKLSFFKNYIGIVSTILFFDKISEKDKNLFPTDSVYGLESKKINEFITEKKFSSKLNFILTPSLYLYDQNLFIYSSYNISGHLPERSKTNLNLNSVLIYHNYINNIFYLGGCDNLLPLFEIFYKYSIDDKNNDIEFLKIIFNNLFYILQVIFMTRKKNALLPLKKEFLFFETLQLFLEKIDIKYYYNNEQLLKELINIAIYYDELKMKKYIEFQEKSGYFPNIFYNPNIIMKFNLNLQEKFLKSIENFSIFLPFEKINKLLLLLSEKYPNDEMEKCGYSKILFNYIYKMFENQNINDTQRESLFLLYKKENRNSNNQIYLLDSIFIHIMEVFILYLDLGLKNKLNESGINRRKNTINNLLYSNNFFVENLLNYLSETNIHVKKVIINFLRILTQTYGDILEQYFYKQGKNKKNSHRINKKEFYDFINENIAPNYSNEDIKEDDITVISRKNEKKVSIFYLEEGGEDKKKVKKEMNIKFGRKKSKSIENKKKYKKDEKIKKIINVFENKDPVKRKNSFSKKTKNNLVEKADNTQKNKNESKIIDKKENIQNIETKIDKNLNKNILTKKSMKRTFTFDQKIVIQNTKCEISLILYNWLVSLISEKEKEKKNDNQNEESIQHVIDYIVKLISYSKELEVIYRTLLLIWDQKDLYQNVNENDIKTNTYYKLLYYLSKNQLFIQMLIELLINSYLYKNLEKDKNIDLFIMNSKSKEDIQKLQEKYINLIYTHSKELLLDIYFDERNINKYDVISQMFCIFLKISKGFEENIDEYKRKILFQFLKEFFLDICKSYNKLKQFQLFDYINFFSYFIEYSFLLKTADDYKKNIYKKIKEDCTHCFPDFLIFGIIYESKYSEWSGYDIYKIIFRNLKQIFHIGKIFENLEFIYKSNKNSCDMNKDIFIYDADLVNSLVNEIVYTKNKKEYDMNVNALFYSYKNNGYENNFPLINILSLFNSLCLYLFYSDINENKKINLITLLNDFQNYIIYLILFSLLLEESDRSLKVMSYNDVQKIIYKNLFFNIKNLLNHLNDKENITKYLEILHNIMLFLSVIYNINQIETNKKNSKGFWSKLFSEQKDISATAPVLLIKFFEAHNEKLFNDENMKFFMKNKKENKEKALELIQNNIQRDIIDNPSFDLYKITIFEKIVKKRDRDLKLKLRLLITEEKEFHTAVNEYKKIFLKIKKFKNYTEINNIQQNQDEIFKIKSYRKIKKDLYSFNNSYSNLDVFYNLKNKKYLLKYKISNYLSRDMTRRLIKPIIDMNYYLPNFRKFKYDSNEIYHHTNDKVYTVDLQIFDNKKEPPLSPDVNNEYEKKIYYIQENVCYIKTTNHIKGKIFYLSNPDKMKYIYFCMTKLPSKEDLLKKYEDYDSLNDSCFSSLFRNNINKKDFDIYLNIKISDIYFIFNRKYCFRDNSLEIFTCNHRSYYFKFKNNKKRNKFLELLLTILNKDSSLFRKLYKPIYSIDENNKKIILGYFKDVDNNIEYSNISNIKELWKNNKISTLEYLMWINMYGNRSYRDIAQYPVFPWIIDDYKTKTFEEIKENDCIRNFKIPMGMMTLDEKGQERADGYISNYKYMSLELKDEQIIDFKIKEDITDNTNENNISDSINDNNITRPKSYTVMNKPINLNDESNIISTDIVNNIKIKKNKCSPKIPKYSYNIDKLYMNLNLEYEQLPYCYGSHYSNSMYISHFLARLFPYSLTMIEIQGSGFDCSERLFLCIEKTFLSSTNEKSDVRELIPEFYTIPEMFMNINELNFGEINLNNFAQSIGYINEVIEKNNGDLKTKVQDVLLPNWSKYNAYLFIQLKRELLENKLKMNPWLDLIFGISQRGPNAQEIGNLYLPYSYDGVLNYRVKEEKVLENREDNEYVIRLFEIGVNATKVFDKKILDTKKNVKQITNIINGSKPIISYIIGFEDKIYNLGNIGNNYNNLIVYYKNNKIKKYIFEEKLDINGNYLIKETNSKDLNETNIFKQNNAISKLIIKNLNKSNLVLVTGFFNEKISLVSLDTSYKLKTYPNIFDKIGKEDQVLLKNYGKGIITSLEISKDEKYIIYGNNKGTLVVIENNYDIYLENNDNKFLKILKIISSHSGYVINTIAINNDLNLFSDYSYDNYIHIYTLPKCEKINSIFIKDNTFNVDYIFLSSQPLASIILYSNKSYKFKCYGINGHDLNVEQNDKDLYKELKNKNCNEYMISPIVFNDSLFIDHLLYVFGYQFILLRKMPKMDIVFKINFNKDEIISLVNISPCKEYIYAVDNNYKRIHLIKYQKNKENKIISANIPNNENNNII